MQLPECHLPLAPAFTVANTDRCISVWIWGYMYGRQPVAWWADEIQEWDLALLGAKTGDPAWQSEWELLAVAISARLFGPQIASQAVHLTTDNTGVLHMALNLRASSPGMVAVAAELACVLRQFDIDLRQGNHVRSAANYLADALSRLSRGAAVPAP